MTKLYTIKLNKDFKTAYYHGKAFVHPLLILYVRKNREKTCRIGITTGKKLGHAGVRNRARRRLREVYRLNEHRFKPGYDIVVVARSRCITADFQKLTNGYLSLAQKAGILKDQ